MEYITLKNSYIKKILKNTKKYNSLINIFLYDDDKNKLYGYYEIDFSNRKQIDDNYTSISISDNYKRRRGIYYKLEGKYSDFSIYEIDLKTFSKRVLIPKYPLINTNKFTQIIAMLST